MTRPPSSQPDRLLKSYQLAKGALADLAKGNQTTKTLHRLRIHLRRLQALYELIGDSTTAGILSQSVSRFSKLRTLQVLLKYLKDGRAPDSDRRCIRRQIKKQKARLEAKGVYGHVRQILRQYARPPMPAHARWLTDRLICQRPIRLAQLRGDALATAGHPRRRSLHALRLIIKSLRYQEECGFGHEGAHPRLVQVLKEAQAVLGAYEERAQFRKLARRLDLKSGTLIERDFRRAQKLARVLPDKLALDLQPFLASRDSSVTPARPQ